jgi:large subunit ribosomal protein L13
MKTYSPKPEHIQRRWYVLDASEQVLGRLATEVAHILRGKHKPIYAPHADVGDHVIVVNASKVVLTGGKTKKIAYRHSGHPGGITATVYEDLLARRPAFAVEKAVRGMLPKNRLGRSMIKKLHVEAGPEHRHQAQKPEAWSIGTRPAWEGLPVAAPVAPTRPSSEPGTGTAEATRRPESGRKTAATAAPAKRTSARKSTAPRTAAAKKTTAARKTTATKKTAATKEPPAAKKTTATRKATTRKPAARAKKKEA